MQKIITDEQQTSLLRLSGEKRLKRQNLAAEIGVSIPTLGKILDSDTPLIVSGKTFNAVNSWLISELT